MSVPVEIYKLWPPFQEALARVDDILIGWVDSNHVSDVARETIRGEMGWWGGVDLRERLALELLEAKGYLAWELVEHVEAPPPGWSVGDLLAQCVPGAPTLRDDNGDWLPWVVRHG